MIITAFTSLRKRLWFYFVLVMLVALSTSLVVIWQIENTRRHAQKHIDTSATANNDRQLTNGVMPALPLPSPKGLLWPMGLGIIACMVLAAWAIHRIMNPLLAIMSMIDQLADGKLNYTAAVHVEKEYMDISNRLNELSANLQELLLYIWNQTEHSCRLLDLLDQPTGPTSIEAAGRRQVVEQVAALRQSMEDIQNMVAAYGFFDVRLEDHQAVAANELGEIQYKGLTAR